MKKMLTNKKLFILLLLAFFLSACPGKKIDSAQKSPEIITDENSMVMDEDDEEYDSSAVYSQDSDN